MSQRKSEIIFEVRQLKRGAGYFILVTEPSGHERHITDFKNGAYFKTEVEAQRWIDNESKDWLASHKK